VLAATLDNVFYIGGSPIPRVHVGPEFLTITGHLTKSMPGLADVDLTKSSESCQNIKRRKKVSNIEMRIKMRHFKFKIKPCF
jgi:hypothetical protein